ncbi:MAG TPA: hypothetical protein VLR69_19235, partial [Thermoanaerobaculia bacterium]|nr:hypothetical protein [Thermoanaerobaculia bacterium]
CGYLVFTGPPGAYEISQTGATLIDKADRNHSGLVSSEERIDSRAVTIEAPWNVSARTTRQPGRETDPLARAPPHDMPGVRYRFRGPTPVSIKIVIVLALLNFSLGSVLDLLSSRPETHAWTSGSVLAAYRNWWFAAHFVLLAAGFILMWFHRGELVAEKLPEIGDREVTAVETLIAGTFAPAAIAFVTLIVAFPLYSEASRTLGIAAAAMGLLAAGVVTDVMRRSFPGPSLSLRARAALFGWSLVVAGLVLFLLVHGETAAR